MAQTFRRESGSFGGLQLYVVVVDQRCDATTFNSYTNKPQHNYERPCIFQSITKNCDQIESVLNKKEERESYAAHDSPIGDSDGRTVKPWVPHMGKNFTASAISFRPFMAGLRDLMNIASFIFLSCRRRSTVKMLTLTFT